MRLTLLAIAVLTLMGVNAHADIIRSCQAHYQVTFTSPSLGQVTRVFGGNPRAASRPGEFRARASCNNTNPNACRRSAARRAHGCMQAHFDAWDQGNRTVLPMSAAILDRPNACNVGLIGYDVPSFADAVGIATCLGVDFDLAPGAGPDVRLVEISRKTHGQSGCSGSGSGNTLSRSMGSNILVDCAYFAARFGPGWDSTSEDQFDRPGGDMSISPVPASDAAACREECAGRPACQSWTFVDAANQCWLKDTLPQGRRAGCCESGSKPFNISLRLDRPGADLPNMPITLPHRFACQTRCDMNGSCRSWTFVEATKACFLKGGVPTGVASACCSSGVK